MQLSITDYIAVYGALVATFVLIWDVVKWLSTGARLRVTANCHVFYEDSRVVKVSQTEYGESHELAEYCHVEISNVGDQPATLLSIEATHIAKRKSGRLGCHGKLFTTHFGKTLPHVLSPGEVWSARIEMPFIYQLAQRGKPIIRINTSTSHRPLSIKPKVTHPYE